MKRFLRTRQRGTIVIGSLLLIFAFLTSGLPVDKSGKAERLSKVSITVSDMEEALDFYTRVLPFQKVREYELSGPEIESLFGIQGPDLLVRVVELSLGNERIELMVFENISRGRAIPADSRSNDLWFQQVAIVVSDMKKAYERLFENKVTHVSTAPQTLPDYLPAAAGISAFYFRDPDGHNLELIYFPEGKGDPKWQNQHDKLFLGIDHTAIGINDTDESLAFHRNLLGLRIAGKSENYGTEQEHLNQVFGARLMITGLRADQGYGLEYLQYLAPPGGRPYPVDSRPNDLWHWHTTLKVTDARSAYEQMLEENYALISNGLVSLDKTDLNANKGFLVRDPDGHAFFIHD